MRSPSNAMLRLPATTGHGSTMWVTALAAGASPAPKLTESRRSRYMSVQAPVGAAAARAASSVARRKSSLRRIIRSLAHVEDMADLRRTTVRVALEPPDHRGRQLRLAEQEEVGVVRRPRCVERRAQHVAGPRRPHEARRHDDDEVGLFLLIGRAARERAKDRHVGEPGKLTLIDRIARLQETGDREALAVAQFDRRV